MLMPISRKSLLLASLVVVCIVVASLLGLMTEYYSIRNIAPSTIVSTLTISNTVTEIHFVTYTTTAPIPKHVQLSGIVSIQNYVPQDVYFECECPSVQFNQTSTTLTVFIVSMSPVTNVNKSTFVAGNQTYTYYTGNYSVDLLNNRSYSISVNMQMSPTTGGSFGTGVTLLPMYSIVPVINDYNIYCGLPSSNISYWNLRCSAA